MNRRGFARIRRFALLAGTISLLRPEAAFAQFGANGIVITSFGGSACAQSLILQPDGKLVAGGYSNTGDGLNNFTLARYHPDGSLDTGFGVDGTVVTSFGGDTPSGIACMVLQPDGKLVAAGECPSLGGKTYPVALPSIALARYVSNGNLDTVAFGSNGIRIVSKEAYTIHTYGLVLEPDGKLAAAGSECPPAPAKIVRLTRFDVNGNSEAAFKTQIGSWNLGPPSNFGGTEAGANGLIRQPDGKLVTAGYCTLGTGATWNFALTRFKSNGSLDTDFDSDGIVITPIGNTNDRAACLVLQPDGKLTAAGYSYNGSDLDFALARYNSDGSLDGSFGGGGTVVTPLGTGDDAATCLALQPDGKLVAAGYSVNGGNRDFALIRYNSDGSLDGNFGTGGKVVMSIGAGDDTVNSLVLQPDGKIAVAGSSSDGAGDRLALARYDRDGCLDLWPDPTPTPVAGVMTHYIYVIDTQNVVIRVYDQSDPTKLLCVLPLPYQTWGIYICGRYAYLVNGQGTLAVMDISDPNNPRDIGRYQTGGEAAGISGYGNYVLVADGPEGVAVYDASMSSDMRMIKRVTIIGNVGNVNARSISVENKARQAYVVIPGGAVLAMDLTEFAEVPSFSEGGYATPNPFLPRRGQKAFFNFRFEVPTAFTIRIYNLRGRLQRTLSGTREWDGRGESGHLCEGGVYVYQIEAEGKRVSGKVVLIK